LQPARFAVDTGASGLVASAQALVAKLLTDKGYTADAAAELNLQVTLSDRPAALSLQNGQRILSPAAGKKTCAERDYRVGITLTRIADGAEYYRSSSAEFHCKLTMEQVLDNLVRAALSDLGAPRGSYTVKRPR
jgi:hypothetical protein